MSIEPSNESESDVPSVPPRKRRRWVWLVSLTLLVGGVLAWPYLNVLWDAYRGGFLKRDDPGRYEASITNNLKALHTAIMLHHDSEGAFPKASEWMDQIGNRVKREGMTPAEADSKFTDPSAKPALGDYGLAFNDAASEKYKDDLAEPARTILIFQSTDMRRNAHGNPVETGRPGGRGITVSGEIVSLGDPVASSP